MMPPPAYSETDPGYGQATAPAFGGGEVMVVAGGWDGDRALETVEMLDPKTGQWSFLPNMMGKCEEEKEVFTRYSNSLSLSTETRPRCRCFGRISVRGWWLEH